MSEESEGQPNSWERLLASKTLAEILGAAISFERTARDFYRRLSPTVGEDVGRLLEELAEQEQQHYDLFKQLAQSKDIATEIDKRIKPPESDARYTRYIELPDLGTDPDELTILRYAMTREQIAMEQYQELSETTPTGPVQELFAYLCNEEKQHKRVLQELYDQVLSSGTP